MLTLIQQQSPFKMPKKIDHQQRKEEILRVALRLFAEQGYEATSSSDIAKACKIARPTLYHYFRNKQQVLFFAIQQFTNHFIQSYQVMSKNEKLSPLERLRLILAHVMVSCHEKHQEMRSLSYFLHNNEAGEWSMAKLIHRRSRPLKKILLKLLEEAETKGMIYQLGTANYLRHFIDMLVSNIIYVLLFPEENVQKMLGTCDNLFALIEIPKEIQGEVRRPTLNGKSCSQLLAEYLGT